LYPLFDAFSNPPAFPPPQVFGYTTFWVTKTEPTGEFGEGTVFIGNLRGERSKVYAKLKAGVAELFGPEKYDLFMVEEEDAEGEDARGGPRVSFKLFRKEVRVSPLQKLLIRDV
jgi:hypothetical protein